MTENQRILLVSKGVWDHIGRRGPIPRVIRWLPCDAALGMGLPSDQSDWDDDVLVLPEQMKGKLEAEEWRPLITSSYVYGRELHTKRVRGYLARWLVLFPLLMLFWFISALFLIAPASPLANVLNQTITGVLFLPYFIAYIFFVAWASVRVRTRFVRGLRLLADRKTFRELNLASLLQVLSKIDSLSLQNPEPIGQSEPHTSTSGDMNPATWPFRLVMWLVRLISRWENSLLFQGFPSIDQRISFVSKEVVQPKSGSLLSLAGGSLTLLVGSTMFLDYASSPTAVLIELPVGILAVIAGIFSIAGSFLIRRRIHYFGWGITSIISSILFWSSNIIILFEKYGLFEAFGVSLVVGLLGPTESILGGILNLEAASAVKNQPKDC